MLLLCPGPVTLTDRVRRSLLRTDLCHRETEFFDLQDEVRARLLAIYALDPKAWSATLITASGTGAVESMMTSLVPLSGRVLIVANGVYGERIMQVCKQYHIPHEAVSCSWLRAPDLNQIEKCIAESKGQPFSHLAIVHHETTTGRLNDLSSMGALCAAHGVSLVVDGVSSFGAEAVNFAEPCLTAVAASANKCLHGAPGISFVIARREAIERAVTRSYYLDLARLASLQDQRDVPFTPAVQVCNALAEALREFAEEGGRAARYQRYAVLAEQVRAGFQDLGVAPAIPVDEASVVLRAYCLPRGLSYDRLHDSLKRAGFVIYAGQRELSRTHFRISTMGNVISADIDRLLSGVSDVLRRVSECR
jgi:2-aminoethylphosphonate-pyruvate transaminase